MSETRRPGAEWGAHLAAAAAATTAAERGEKKAPPPPLHPLLSPDREYPFVILDRMRARLSPPELAIINFGVGDPRERTPEFIKETLRGAIPEMSSYPSTNGQPALRAAAAAWLARRFGVEADPEKHILPATGSKEAVFLLHHVVIDPRSTRRTVVIPSPAYPVYDAGTRFAGGEPYLVPLRSADRWHFQPSRVPGEVWEKTALLWLNSPHNPTGATLALDELRAIAELAKKYGFWVAADEAYAEVYFDLVPPSMLQAGFENVIAFHTLSKRSAMTGFRSGFVCGDERLIDAFRRFRPNVGVATPDFVQAAAIAAWRDDAHPGDQRARYAIKRKLFLDYFEKRGWKVEASEASFYLWLKAPSGNDVEFVEAMLRVGIVALPGSFLGTGGEGFVRFALVPTPEGCREAIERLEQVK